jgi:acetylxylan esterase
MRSLSTLAAFSALATISNALTSSLQQVTGFDSTPTGALMYVYIPTTKVSPAPIIVAIHQCTGSATEYYESTLYAQYADTYGYIVVYPSAVSDGTCWDVASIETLTHNGGGDSETIVNMVTYAVNNYGGDSTRVFATGSSSGAMMTNVLAGAYPNVFKAGSVYSGVADGCFYVSGATANMETPGWNSECADGDLSMTAASWGSLVHSYYPGYTGSYPRMLEWHGTIDTTLYYPNLAQELLEWSDVLGVSFSHNNTNTPQSEYTQMVYGDGTQLIGYSAVGVGHTVPVHETVDLAWFCISAPCGTTGGTTTTTAAGTTLTTSKTTSSTTSGSTGTQQSEYGQCGGVYWTGPTSCVAGTTCVYSNAYYSQCLPP